MKPTNYMLNILTLTDSQKNYRPDGQTDALRLEKNILVIETQNWLLKNKTLSG